MDSDQAKKTEKKIERTRSEIVELHPTKPDITEHKKAEEAVRRSKQQWEKTFNAMSDWVVLIDVGGRIIRTNRIGEDFTGKPLAEIIGQSCCKLVHGSDKHLPGCPLKKMLQTGQQASTELQVPGTDRWLMVTVDPITDNEGNIVGAVHITQDITQRKKDEKALRDSEERYKYLFEQSPLGIGLATSDGRLVHINKAMEVITGYFNEELKKINLADIYENPQDREKLLETIERYGCAVDFPTRLKRKDGTVYDALLNVSRVKLGGQDLFQTICMDITERKRAEEALRESEEKYRDIFENAREAIITMDLKGKITDANKIVEEYGLKREELPGRNLFDFIAKDYLTQAVSDFETLIAGNPVRGEMDVITPKGTITVEYSDNPIERDAEIIGVQAILTDITERKQAEEQIEKLARFPAENQSPVLRISARGTVIYGNEASLPLMKVWQCRVGESLPAEWHEIVLDALSSGDSQQTEVKYDGRTFSLVFAPVMDANYVNVYGLDITECKKAEEEAREGRDYLEKLTNSMWDAVFSVKMPERVIEWANDSFRLTGYEPEDYVGSTTEFLYPDRKEYIDFGNKLQKAINAGEDVLHAEQILRRKNGEIFPAEITTTFFREKGEITNVTSIISDITERKRVEEKLLAYQKQLKSLASQMTLTEEQERRRIATDLHDNITQSLAMSKLKLDLVRDSKSSSSADLVEVLNETSRNIEQIIQEVRTLTFDLSSPILYELGFEAAVAEWLTERIGKGHGIATEFEDDEQPKPLDDDTRTVLFRDVRELLTNVVKHAQAKKVKVSVRKVGSRIHVSVEDDGRGFDPEKVAATAVKTGEFGLFSIRERLKQLGGNIEIESASGHGTRVNLVAPLKSKSLEEKRE